MVLSLDSPEGKRRIAEFKSDERAWLPALQPIIGLDFKTFQNENEMMGKYPFALPERARQEWRSHDKQIGTPTTDRKPTGSLACAMGHRYMWTQAANIVGTTRVWSLIFEDDARFVGNPPHSVLSDILLHVPPDVHLVFLDDHCADFTNKAFTNGGSTVSGSQTNLWARYSSAYAVTPEGAKQLLNLPFKFNSDHLLNAAVKCYGLKAFCPYQTIFTNQYPHNSTINVALTADYSCDVIRR